MTISDVEKLKLGISPVTDKTCIIVESALLYINENTTLNYNIDDLPESIPANVKLFIVKYFELLSARSGVSSESIDGLSQSFDTTDRGALLREFAEELLGGCMKSDVAVMQAKSRWR